MEKPNSRQVRFDGTGGLAALLHPEDIAGQMLAADILQLLEMKRIRQVSAEPLHGFIIACLGAETALAVMPGQLIQLAYQGQINAYIFNISCHIKNLLVDYSKFRKAQFTPWRIRLFPLDFQRNRNNSDYSHNRNPLQQRRFIEQSTTLAEACLFLIMNQVSTNAVWGYSLLPDRMPSNNC